MAVEQGSQLGQHGLAEVGGVEEPHAPVAEHAQPEPLDRRLAQELELPLPDAHLDRRVRFEIGLDLLGAGALGLDPYFVGEIVRGLSRHARSRVLRP